MDSERTERGSPSAIVDSQTSGKSTLLRILATALRADRGTATVGGHNLHDLPAVRGTSFVTRFLGDFVIGVGHRRGQAGPDPQEV